MKDTVRLIHQGFWYKAYRDDAKVLAEVTNFKLFEDSKSKAASVGFPEYSLDKVTNLLCMHRINYQLVNDDEKIHDFGKLNNYQKYLNRYTPFSSVAIPAKERKKPKGKFLVQYEGEEKEEYIIGNNISEDAELVKRVLNNNEDDIININGYNVKIIKKEIEFK